MKKTYQTPLCQILELDDIDILTISTHDLGNWDEGDVGPVIDWSSFSL